MLTYFIIPKTMQLLLYLLTGCRAAETLTDRLTDLGQNVTINCSFNVKEVNWLLLKLPDPPVLILLTFSTPHHYYNNRFKPKYSGQNKPHLFINNVTTDDLGLYYCVTTDLPPKYSNGTKLHITEIQNLTQCQTFTLISALLNDLLIIVVIGLLKKFILVRRRSRDSLKPFQNANLQQPQVMVLEQLRDVSLVQFAVVDVPTSYQRFQSSHVNSTYALLQLLKFSLSSIV